MAWARAAQRAVRPFSTGGTYVNFLTEEDGEQRIRAAYGRNYRGSRGENRLGPGRTSSRMNKNITPRRTA